MTFFWTIKEAELEVAYWFILNNHDSQISPSFSSDVVRRRHPIVQKLSLINMRFLFIFFLDYRAKFYKSSGLQFERKKIHQWSLEALNVIVDEREMNESVH